MEVNDGSNEWDAIMSAHEKEDEIRRMTVICVQSVDYLFSSTLNSNPAA